jgi:ABC-type multidrug transport system ATPase subunit
MNRESSKIAGDDVLKDGCSWHVPLVEIKLENVTYAPVLAGGVASGAAATPASTADSEMALTQRSTITVPTPLEEGDATKIVNQRRKVILRNITTAIRPYSLTAWMGASGSGKSSLLSVAAGLAPPDSLLLEPTPSENPGGRIIVNNTVNGVVPKRFVGVVWQDDLLLSNLTVEENILFAARFKMPQSTAFTAIQSTVVDTMEQLGLLHVRHSLVGNPLGHRGGGGAKRPASSQRRSMTSSLVQRRRSSTTSTKVNTSEQRKMPWSRPSQARGISGGERKRVSVAVELVVRPSVLLLDEPTSGLDSTTALSLIQTLRELATTGGHAIVVIIHQPRTTIYNLFDHLLLLSKGQVVYNGPPSLARSHFEAAHELGVAKLPPETGIADWIMDIIVADEQLGSNGKKNGGRVLPQHWAEYAALNNTSEYSAKTGDMSAASPEGKYESSELCSLDQLVSGVPRYTTTWSTQLKLLLQRTIKQHRGERLTMTAALLQTVYLFFTAIFWWQLPDSTSWIFERNSLLFFMLIAQANGIVISAVTIFQQERLLLHRERAKKMYGVSPYFLAKTVSDMSTNVLFPMIYIAIVYWTAGFRAGFVYYVKCVLAFYLTLSTAQSMGLWLSVFIPNMQIALILAPPITLFFMIMGGFYIPFDSMNKAIYWATYLSFARYGYSSLIINEYENRMIPCASDGLDDTDTTGTSSGDECPVPGEAVIESFGLSGVTANFWFNIGMIVILQIGFRLAAYMNLRRSR